ncbi:hypothetical protein M8C21_032067, partial [Ambrosia artemisiifolia]
MMICLPPAFNCVYYEEKEETESISFAPISQIIHTTHDHTCYIKRKKETVERKGETDGSPVVHGGAPPRAGSTPIHYAVCGGSAQCCQCLISRGASLTAKNAKGWTPLAVAHSWNRDWLEEVLVEEPHIEEPTSSPYFYEGGSTVMVDWWWSRFQTETTVRGNGDRGYGFWWTHMIDAGCNRDDSGSGLDSEDVDQYKSWKEQCQRLVPIIGTGNFVMAPLVSEDESDSTGILEPKFDDESDKKVTKWKLSLHLI